VSIALRARTLWKSYAAGVEGCSARAWVLRGTSLDVEQGECVAVLGAAARELPTLLYCLAGLRRPDAGSVETTLDPLLVGATSFRRRTCVPTGCSSIDDALCPAARRSASAASFASPGRARPRRSSRPTSSPA
jgi:ABC-type multidrug transport system ATPase subunit